MEGEYGSDVVFWFDEHHGYYDPYTIPETVERFTWYGISSWPYVRVDGSRYLVGAFSCEEAAADLRALIDARLDETGGMSPVEIQGYFDVDDVSLEFDVTFSLVDQVSLTDLRGTFVAIEDVEEGTEYYSRATRAIRYETVILINQGDELHVHVSIPCDPEWDPSVMTGVVFLQQTVGPKPVIQGAVLPDPSAVEPMDGLAIASLSGIENVYPNPFAGSTEIRFTLSETASSGTIRLEVFDLGGQRVEKWRAGDVGPGQHVWSWDGLSDDGNRLRGGVYFVRLQTQEGEDRRKVTLLR